MGLARGGSTLHGRDVMKARREGGWLIRLFLVLSAAGAVGGCRGSSRQPSPPFEEVSNEGAAAGRGRAADTSSPDHPSPGSEPRPALVEHGPMRVAKIPIYSVGSNCYLVWDVGSKLTAVVDPGGEAAHIFHEAQARGLKVVGIVETHGHYDHIGGSAELQGLTGAPVYRHPSRIEKGGGLTTKALDQGDKLALGAVELKALYTSGHDPGSLCLYGERVLLTGDLLFKGSVGRTDIEGGNQAQLFHSIFEVLAEIPDETVVLPGHGPPTTMGDERRTNPFLVRGTTWRR